MDVSYNDKDYTLEIEKFVYDKCRNNSDDIVLYYDAKGDDVFVAGSGAGNLVATALITVVVVIIGIIILIWMLIKYIKKKK